MTPSLAHRLLALVLAVIGAWPQASAGATSACGSGLAASGTTCCCPSDEAPGSSLSRSVECVCCEGPVAPSERGGERTQITRESGSAARVLPHDATGEHGADRPVRASHATRAGTEVLRLHCVIRD